jgi:hypothetical protein
LRSEIVRLSERPQITERSVGVSQYYRKAMQDCEAAPALQVYRVYNVSKYRKGAWVIIQQ